MKKLLLFVLLVGSNMSFAMEDDDKEIHMVTYSNTVNNTNKNDDDSEIDTEREVRKNKKIRCTPKCKEYSWKTVTHGGVYLMLALSGSAGLATVEQSVHNNITMVALPYNQSLTDFSDTYCQYKQKVACGYNGMENTHECEDLVEQEGVYTQKFCNYGTTYDRQFAPGLITAVASFLGFCTKIVSDFVVVSFH